MTKYDKIKKFLEFLESVNESRPLTMIFDGNPIRFLDDSVTETTKPVLSWSPQLPNVPEKQIEENLSKVGTTPVQNVKWARGPKYTNVVITKLLKKGIHHAEDLEYITIADLKHEKWSEGTINMIREGLGSLNKHLKGDTIHKRK